MKHFSVEDIARYYNGLMSPQEMHDLEKAALEDSFLAEALEGFNHTSTPEDDVAILKAQLKNTIQKGRVVSIKGQKNYRALFRIAALFLLLLGAGWFVFEFAISKPEQNISLNDQAEKQDKVIQERQKSDQTQIEQSNPEIKARIEDKVEDKSTGLPLNKEKKTSSTSLKKNEYNNPTLPDTNDQPVAMAQDGEASSVIREKREAPVVTVKRSAVNLDEGKPSNAKVDVTQDGNKVIITLNETQDSVSEYVLRQNKKDSLVKKGPRIIVEEAEPEESWSSFGSYISDHLPENLQTETLKGTVKLSFEVNPSGKPVNILVEKSLCPKCDEETLKLLEEGPKWKRKLKRGKVSFSF